MKNVMPYILVCFQNGHGIVSTGPIKGVFGWFGVSPIETGFQCTPLKMNMSHRLEFVDSINIIEL